MYLAKDKQQMRIIIDRYDLFIMWADSPHCGCEILSNRTHYYIHAFCESVEMEEAEDIDASQSSVCASSCPIPSGPHVDANTGQLNYGLKSY